MAEMAAKDEEMKNHGSADLGINQPPHEYYGLFFVIMISVTDHVRDHGT